MRLLIASFPLVIAGLACTPTGSESAPEPTEPAASSPTVSAPSATSSRDRAEAVSGAAPRLKVTRVVDGLDIPWDVQEIPGGRDWRLYAVAPPSGAALNAAASGDAARPLSPESGR